MVTFKREDNRAGQIASAQGNDEYRLGLQSNRSSADAVWRFCGQSWTKSALARNRIGIEPLLFYLLGSQIGSPLSKLLN